MQPIPWRRRALVGAVPAVVLVALLVRVVMVGSPEGWALLVALVPAFGFIFYRARRQLRSIRLTLEETGFRYTKLGYDITVSWAEVRTLEQRVRGDKLTALAILTTQDKYLMLAGFERMPEIADFIGSRVTSRAPDAVGAFRLNKHVGWLFIAMLVGGIGLRAQYGEQSPWDDIALLLQMGGLGGLFWMSPINVRAQQYTPVRRFFVLLAMWVTIVIVVLLVLAYFSPKPR